MSRLRSSLGRLAFELVLVFVAVVSALLTNAWWQTRSDRAAARLATTAFVAEMTTNRKEISSRVAQHGIVLANAQALATEIGQGATPPTDVRALRDRLTLGKGFGLPLLSHAAWDTALATGVVGHMPLATVQRLAAVYESQRRLETMLDRMIASWMEPDLYDPKSPMPAASSFLVTFGMLVELENNQMQIYESAAKAIASP